MDKSIITLIIICCVLFHSQINAQTAHMNLRNGDMLYEYGKYNDAETEYRRAENSKPSVKSSYNLGNSLYNQERYNESVNKYKDAAAKALTSEEKSIIYHNQGNALFKEKKYKESIDGYKKSLKYNPSNLATKENLAIAQNELKKQIRQQKKDQQDKQNKEKDQKDQPNNDEQESNDPNKNKQNNNQNNKENEKQNQDNKGEKEPTQNKKMTRQDAQKLLEVIDNEEKKVQQKLRRANGGIKKSKKDW